MSRSLLAAALCLWACSAGSSKTKETEAEPEKKDLGSWYEAGDTRVQCLTPTLVRVEKKGPQGFEDRTTFMVRNRDMGGVDIQSAEEGEDGTTIRTDHYSVVVTAEGFKVLSPSGDPLYDSSDGIASNLLMWPAPQTAGVYAINDHPRFHVPEWTVAPRSDDQTVDEDLEATNGYDFRNQLDGESGGDIYVFLLGEGVEGWNNARKEFAQLSGPVPLLPDFAFGTWFTWWHPYTEWEAKEDLDRWDNEALPIDVWGLDMNWRHIHDDWDREYNHPNDSSFDDLPAFIGYLNNEKKLRTFFNDHPYPNAPQLSGDEIGFRWEGLTRWMDCGVSWWWFDHNWKFSIPPPHTEGSDKDSVWEGLTTVSWGSHVFFSIVKHYDLYSRKEGDLWYGGRPMTLSKAMVPDWEEGMGPEEAAQSPSQHRYPVWWTGDKVTLQASVESMVDAGVHHFKPYVHSDCGGDYFAEAGDLLRWTAHCTFGTIFRYHGCDHRPWMWGMHTEANIRNYLNVRYRLQPSLVAAGFKATLTGHPLVARCDLYWPWIEDARSNSQYIFLEDMLVAPIADASDNWTTKNVWFPPGNWQDAWDGAIYKGDKDKGTAMDKTLPYEKIPLFFKRDGGLVVLVDDPKLRTDDQDWSQLTLEAFPSDDWCQTNRTVYDRSTKSDPAEVPHQHITMTSDGQGQVTIEIDESHADSEEGRRLKANATGATGRGWTVRLNLRAEHYVDSASVDGQELEEIVHITPSFGRFAARLGFFPLQGKGGTPAPYAGPVAEVTLPKAAGKRTVVAKIKQGYPVDSASLVEIKEGAKPLVAAAQPAAGGHGEARGTVALAGMVLLSFAGVAVLGVRRVRSRTPAAAAQSSLERPAQSEGEAALQARPLIEGPAV